MILNLEELSTNGLQLLTIQSMLASISDQPSYAYVFLVWGSVFLSWCNVSNETYATPKGVDAGTNADAEEARKRVATTENFMIDVNSSDLTDVMRMDLFRP